MKPPVLVRPAHAEDLPRINEIYNHYILETPATFDLEPYTAAQRQEWFAHYGPAGQHRVFVAESGGAVVGMTWSSVFRPKRAYGTTIETSVYCAPEATGVGVGSALYGALFAALKGEPIHRALAGITQPNEASVRLHRRFGFGQVALFSEVGHKFGRYWDVAWFEKELP
ncbi:MAG: GNAT family N-acetyltransferase [Tepidiformaceae bacterium]